MEWVDKISHMIFDQTMWEKEFFKNIIFQAHLYGEQKRNKKIKQGNTRS